MKMKTSAWTPQASKLSFIVTSVLLFAFSIGTLAQAAPREQGNTINFNLRYKLIASPRTISLCVGESKKVQVFLDRILTQVFTQQEAEELGIGGSATPNTSHELVFFARVKGLMHDTSVADFAARQGSQAGGSPPDEYSTISGPLSAPRAWFIVKGKAQGTTTVTFDVIRMPLTETTRFPVLGKWPIDLSAATVDIEVVPCYQAYASGLTTGNVANVWSDADICDLESPFVLDASGAGAYGEASFNINTSVLIFGPILGTNRGVYASLQKEAIQTPSGTRTCWNIGSGGYDVTWYTADKSEGDIHLQGSYSFCGNQSRNFDIRIAIRTMTFDPASQNSCKRP